MIKRFSIKEYFKCIFSKEIIKAIKYKKILSSEELESFKRRYNFFEKILFIAHCIEYRRMLWLSRTNKCPGEIAMEIMGF